MQDNRAPLQEGTVLFTDTGITYTIINSSFGKGGNSLIYAARRSDSERLFIIKECYPLSQDYSFIRSNTGLIIPDSDNSKAELYYQKCIDRMIKECELGQNIAQKSGRIIVPWENTTIIAMDRNNVYSEIQSQAYITMEQYTDKGVFISDIYEECRKTRSFRHLLRTSGAPDLFTIIAIVVEVLKALDTIHKSGYMHGDIQPNNLFFVNPNFDVGDIGIGHLMDFGSARQLFHGKTLEISDKEIYSTDGYTAPEILYGNNGHLCLTPATDIFSVGCLLLYLIKGDNYKNTIGKTLTKISRRSFIDAREIASRGGTSEISQYLNEILSCALSINPDYRFQSAFEMLEVTKELRDMLYPIALNNMLHLTNASYVHNSNASQHNYESNYDEYCLEIIEVFDDKVKKIIQLNSVEKIDLTQLYIREEIVNPKKARFGKLVDLRNLVAEHRMILWGTAGAGKTTSLEHLKYIDATAYLSGASQLPVLIYLGSTIEESKSLIDYITEELKVDSSVTEHLLKKGKLNLYFDGFNEIPFTPQNSLKSKRRRELTELIKKYPKCFIILSNRPQETKEFSHIPVFSLMAMENEQIVEFVNKNAEQNIQSLIFNAINENRHLKEMIRNPLILKNLIFVAIHTGSIYTREGLIIGQFLRSLIRREIEEKYDEYLDERKLWCLLRKIGYESLERNKTNAGLLEKELFEIMNICQEEYHFNYDNLYALRISLHLGILEKRNNTIVFAHQAYQEYFHSQELKYILGHE